MTSVLWGNPEFDLLLTLPSMHPSHLVDNNPPFSLVHCSVSWPFMFVLEKKKKRKGKKRQP